LAADHPITHVTTFRLSDGAPEDCFIGLWTRIGHLMSGRPGFVSARLYRPVLGATAGEYIHVAQWTREALLADARSDPEIRSLEERVETLVASRRRVVCDAATDAILPPN
jgi:heme-degrading monooxygenase HmoA